jgi:hypothetical protein
LILLLPPSSPNTPVSFSIQGEINPKQQAAAAAAPERKQREKHGYNPPPELQNAAETNTTERKGICKTPVTKPPARTEQQKGEERTREKEVATNEHRAREEGRRPATCGRRRVKAGRYLAGVKSGTFL